jgi:hypothetical protein
LYHKAKLKERKRERESQMPLEAWVLNIPQARDLRVGQNGPLFFLLLLLFFYLFIFFYFFWSASVKILGDEDENWYRLETRRVSGWMELGCWEFHK